MKIFLKTFIFFLVATSIFTSCQPEEHKVLGEPRDILSSLAGNWKLIKATQVDEDASRKGFPYKEADITSLFPYTDFKLGFNLTNGLPGTFTTTPGASPKIIKLASGSWTADNNQYPKVLTLTSGATTEKVTLGSYPVGASTTLKLKVERKDAGTGKLLITYNYEFSKI